MTSFDIRVMELIFFKTFHIKIKITLNLQFTHVPSKEIKNVVFDMKIPLFIIKLS